MLKKVAFLSCFVLICGFVVKNEEPVKVQDFTLEDYNGVKHSLSDYKNSKAIVLMFIATQCPVSNAYNSRMNDLYRDYNDKRIALVGVNSNKGESVKEIKEHAQEKGFKFPILKDVKNVIADRFGATVTPEVYVLNPDLQIVYHGRIDNSSRIDKVTSNDLRNTLDEILNSKPVEISSTKAFGCTIKKVD